MAAIPCGVGEFRQINEMFVGRAQYVHDADHPDGLTLDKRVIGAGANFSLNRMSGHGRTTILSEMIRRS
jgi:hypothetical protein